MKFSLGYFEITRHSNLGMVLFDDGEDLQVIEVPLISSSKFEEFVEFKVVLIEPQGKCSLGNNQKENIKKKLFRQKCINFWYFLCNLIPNVLSFDY